MKDKNIQKNNHIIAWKYIIFAYILIVSIILLWCFSFSTSQLRGHLISITPWFLEINFICIVIGLVLNINVIKISFENILPRAWGLVAVIVLLGFIMALFIAPKTHRIFYDENIYLNIGQTIATQKKAAMCAEGSNNYGMYNCTQLEHNKQPNGFPYLVSVVYRIFGPSETAGFLLNNFLFGVAILIAFAIGYLMFESYAIGIYSSLIYCLIPENIIWANTTAVESGAALFSGLVIFSALLYLKQKKRETLFLFSVLMAFSVQFRPESLCIVIISGLLFLLNDKKILKKNTTYFFLAIAFALVVSHIVHLYAVRGEDWGSAAASRMSLSYFFHNFKTNTLFYLNNAKFPILFSILFISGLILHKKNKNILVLLLWLILFWGIFILFYAGSYEYGQDVRFSLLSYMPLALLAGYGAFRFEEIVSARVPKKYFKIIIVSIILVSFSSFLPHVRTIGEEACQARADHKFAMEMAELLPENSIVLTHNPNMFLLWGKNAAQAAIATNNSQTMDYFFQRYTGGVYFHFNYWCNVDDKREQTFCKNILNKYDCTSMVKYKERGYVFILFRIKNK